MLNFTKEQKQFICWLNQDGNYFEVCSDYGKSNGEIIPQSGLPCRLLQRTINKLYQAGIIYYCPILHYGVRWDRFTLTKKGKEVACSIA